ncbi:MAG TPA: VTT domain-containing protein, partial [Syntrophomonas sp.]|nr:VTT domain-containing protein [Syntrophomonas sp.]
MKRYLKYIPFIPIIVLIIALLPKLLGLEVSDILKYLPESPLLASLFLLGLYCLKSVVVFIPIIILYISAGIMFPIGWALLLTCLGLFGEMTIGYCIGKQLGTEKVTEFMKKSERAEKFLSCQKNIGPSICFLARFLPLPFDIVNMYLGASSIKYSQFVVFTFLGIAPGMIPYVFMGDSISTPLSKEFLIPFIISIAVSICT